MEYILTDIKQKDAIFLERPPGEGGFEEGGAPGGIAQRGGLRIHI